MYYRARYYDVQTGRFLSEDPFRFVTEIDFYRYVSNDPTDLIDPTGLGQKGALVGSLIGGVVGGFLGGTAGAATGAAGGTLFAPGVGTIGGGTVGAIEGATIGGATGAATGAVIGSAFEDLWDRRPWNRAKPIPAPPQTKCDRDESCEKEWADARRFCAEVMSIPRNSPKWKDYQGLWGGSYDRCVRGQVSQRCGGNRVD